MTPPPSKAFPDIRPFTATYRFGWADIFNSAKAEVTFCYPEAGLYLAEARGNTTGLMSALWKVSVTHEAKGAVSGYYPIWMKQQERYSEKRVDTHVCFQRPFSYVTRDPANASGEKDWRKLPVPDLRDLVSAMLFVRAQRLNLGDKIAFTVFPGNRAYFVTVEVLRRDRVSVLGKSMSALVLNLDIKQIILEGKEKGNLVTHSKFHKGTIWISDDVDRIPLRAEVDIFIGYVQCQIASLAFR